MMKKYNINLSISGILITTVIIIMGLFFYSCENTITNISDINYGVVINEINYWSSDIFNPEDWVELYNPTNETIIISLWKFKDENDNNIFTIPADQILSAGQYLVLCEDTIAFKEAFQDDLQNVGNFVGDFGFGLTSEGDQVRLFDSNGNLVDKVEYDNTWPTGPVGTWLTIELIDPSLNNALGGNWVACSGNGTPGRRNSVCND